MATKTAKSAPTSPSRSVNPEEVANFSALAETWWDPNGPFRPLHKMNPVRLEFIKGSLCRHFGRDVTATDALKGLRILDIGCGGGLLCEPLTRLGATMVGADASEKNILTARAHAEQTGLEIDYRYITAEELADAGETFDAILNMEVIEHVADIPSFLDACHRLLKDGGCMTLSTINRSAKAWLVAIAGAEYILRWLPVGTHDWQKFLKPSELSRSLRDSGFKTSDIKGMVYSPLSGAWSLDAHDFSVNYVALAEKA
ncbi:bifunctional 2-polyprenyl-6-hydroxyphenol methylase/3-demethylubiquinol 3-O-methyltransferase UbiG [Emcibacter nanhaiensis]|uniref:Ubiquinone biosynthesis O-methyltransferase n=1 Tax=Emcibacter nanhaiensis TaxID=1505037 RepID=A0A501PLM0_9PROT|nr:bifunctional 2-polyprenyl-6-hydroxyphenol methylase/3-demethylubiquinol 3-O-methyltransferase UbiG [Emcibacter nanhaiensis]TPD61389.1 bifunctional 2-polyprenyl-6-hydroxyphenol methylase/3-demethylubiquinol 3-O-methyltransferase UbiG [Emcibacter nanhaiensis]